MVHLEEGGGEDGLGTNRKKCIDAPIAVMETQHPGGPTNYPPLPGGMCVKCVNELLRI